MTNKKNAYPSALIAFGSRVRPSPFFDATLRWGCSRFTTYNHTYMPSVYESSEADYHYLINAVTLWDVAGERQVEISGKDAFAFTQYLTPRDLASCAPGRCRYVVITNQDGGVINDPVLLRLAEDKFWLSAADTDLWLWVQGVAINTGFDVRISTPDVSPLQLQGPAAAAVASALFGDWAAELPYFALKQFDFEGVPLVLTRSGWSGELGYEIYLCNGEHGDWLWERVMQAGKAHGIRPASPSTIRRIEAGMLSYGADINQNDTPYHLRLDRLVNADTDYIGKTALAAVRTTGVERRLTGIEIGGAPLAQPLVRWWNAFGADGTRIGKVRSAVYSPRLQKNIGIAMLDTPYDNMGKALAVMSEYGQQLSATTCPLPFVPSQR